MKYIAYEDDGLRVLWPDYNSRLVEEARTAFGVYRFSDPAPLFLVQQKIGACEVKYAESELEFLKRVALKDIPRGIQAHVVTKLPDRSRRVEWTLDEILELNALQAT